MRSSDETTSGVRLQRRIITAESEDGPKDGTMRDAASGLTEGSKCSEERSAFSSEKGLASADRV
jgi:hypothetical protein